MIITPDIIKAEFIGTRARIVQSPNLNLVGLHGRVIDESKNTFTFLNEGIAKSVVKETSVFDFQFADGTTVEIDGKLLVARPEDRLKKSIKRLW